MDKINTRKVTEIYTQIKICKKTFLIFIKNCLKITSYYHKPVTTYNSSP